MTFEELQRECFEVLTVLHRDRKPGEKFDEEAYHAQSKIDREDYVNRLRRRLDAR